MVESRFRLGLFVALLAMGITLLLFVRGREEVAPAGPPARAPIEAAPPGAPDTSGGAAPPAPAVGDGAAAAPPMAMGSSSLSGRVVDESKAPVAGAGIVIVAPPGRREAVSSADGTYRIEEVATGRWSVFVSSAEHLDVAWSLEIAGETRQDFVLVAGGLVTGRVTATGSRLPIAGALVRADGHGRIESARSAEDGSFRLGGIADGEYRLGVFHESYRPLDEAARPEFVVDLGAAYPDHLLVELSAGGAIEGRVLDEASNPIAGAVVRTSLESRPSRSAIAADDGSYRIDGLRAGTYVVLAQRGDLARRARIDLASGRRAGGFDLVLGPGGTIACEARLEGRPLRGGVAEVLDLDHLVDRVVELGDDGRFEVDDLPAGRYRIDVFARDRLRFESVEFEIRSPGERRSLVLDLSTGASLEGTAVGPSGPAAGVEGLLFRGGHGVRSETTDRSGRFSFGGLSPGTYDLYLRGRIEDAGELVGRYRLEFGDRERLEMRLELGPPATASGTLVDASGCPLAGVVVGVESRVPGQLRSSVATGVGGVFEVGSLPEGEYVLHVGDARSIGSFAVHGGESVTRLRVVLPAR